MLRNSIAMEKNVETANLQKKIGIQKSFCVVFSYE